MKTRFLLILAACCLPGHLNAQGPLQWPGFGVEANLWGNRMIRHTSTFTGPLSSFTSALEINLIKKTFGQKDWQIRRKFPQPGLGLIYINYHVPDVYGELVGIYPNITLPLIRRKNLELSFRAGMGVGYFTRPYARTPVPNLKNVAIGGHFNNVSPFSLDARISLNRHWDVQAGFNFAHVSNAAFQQPNLGINIWGAHVGMRYFPVTSKPEKIQRLPIRLSDRWLLQARAGMAFVERQPANGPLYPTYMTALFASKRYLSKNKIALGLDYAYLTDMYVFLKAIGAHTGREKTHAYQLAAFAGHEFIYGRVGLLFQAGVYLKEPYGQKNRLYQKLGGNFYVLQRETGLLKEVFFGAYLKTHLFVAERFEMNIGIGI